MKLQITLKMAEENNLIKPQHLKQTYEDLYVDTMSSEEYYKNTQMIKKWTWQNYIYILLKW